MGQEKPDWNVMGDRFQSGFRHGYRFGAAESDADRARIFDAPERRRLERGLESAGPNEA
jgi:hypothetical protein